MVGEPLEVKADGQYVGKGNPREILPGHQPGQIGTEDDQGVRGLLPLRMVQTVMRHRRRMDDKETQRTVVGEARKLLQERQHKGTPEENSEGT